MPVTTGQIKKNTNLKIVYITTKKNTVIFSFHRNPYCPSKPVYKTLEGLVHTILFLTHEVIEILIKTVYFM